MKKRLKRTIFLLTLCTTLCISGFTALAAAPQQETTITIYHTNDTHGALSASSGSIGIDKVAALKDATPNAILVDAGDATQGLPLASLSKGRDIITIMNAAGYDVMAAGNHEFDYGSDVLIGNADAAAFPILAANLYSKTTGDLILKDHPAGNSGCHAIVEREGIQIGFFGLTTNDTRTATNPTGITDVDFRDEIESAKREIDELEQAGADVIIAVAHLGEYTTVPCDSTQLAEAMTDSYAGKLDAIIDGHSHTVELDKVVNGILIQQTGSSLASLGKLDVTVSPDGSVALAGQLLSAADITVEPKAEVTQVIQQIQDSQSALLAEPIGELTTSLWGGYISNIPIARVTETNLGDFMTDGYRHMAENFLQQAEGMTAYQGLPVLAVENGGGIRASLNNGQITLEHLVTVLPFSNTLMMREVTPQIVYEMLENAVSGMTGQDTQTGKLEGTPSGGFLQVSGFSFTYDPLQAVGSKVQSVYVDGSDQPLDRTDGTTRMVLVSNNFIMSGGSRYTMLPACPLVGEIGGELEMVQNYLQECTQNGTVPLNYAVSAPRIKVNGGYTGDSYEAFLTVMEETESRAQSAAANKEVPVYVDGETTPRMVTTDDQGMAKLSLTNGAHGLRTSLSQTQVYVDNATGIGLEGAAVALMYQAPAAEPIPPGQEDPTPPAQGEQGTTPGTTGDGDQSNAAIKPQVQKSVYTGDEAELIFYLVLMAGAGMCYYFVGGKKAHEAK